VEITIAEGSARNNDDVTSATSVWANSGYRDLLTDPFFSGVNLKLLNLNQTINDLQNVDLGAKSVDALQGSVYHIHKAELATNVYIAVPVLKIHDTGITNALKLQIGTAPGCYYGYNKTQSATNPQGIYHDVGNKRWNEEALVDLTMIAYVDFVVIDALMCLQIQKSYNGSNQLRMNTILAGKDPVAVDHICANLFSLNPDDIALITLAECEVESDVNYAGNRVAELKFYTQKPAEPPSPPTLTKNLSEVDYTIKAYPNPAFTYTTISYILP
jgi:uncharacterized protein (DUF362 family)